MKRTFLALVLTACGTVGVPPDRAPTKIERCESKLDDAERHNALLRKSLEDCRKRLRKCEKDTETCWQAACLLAGEVQDEP